MGHLLTEISRQIVCHPTVRRSRSRRAHRLDPALRAGPGGPVDVQGDWPPAGHDVGGRASDCRPGSQGAGPANGPPGPSAPGRGSTAPRWARWNAGSGGSRGGQPERSHSVARSPQTPPAAPPPHPGQLRPRKPVEPSARPMRLTTRLAQSSPPRFPDQFPPPDPVHEEAFYGLSRH
jgi:hypothetical protein